MAALLDETSVTRWLSEHGSWSRADDTISRTVDCASFPAAIELVRRVAEVAEARDHHPDIDIRWRTVTFALSTHSEGGLTEKDLAMAEQIDALAG